MRRFSWCLPFLLLMLFIIPSSAAFGTPENVEYSSSAVSAWDSMFSAWWAELLPTDVIESTWRSHCWAKMDDAMYAAVYGEKSSLPALENAASTFNSRMRNVWSGGWFASLTTIGHIPTAIVDYVSTLGAYALVDKETGILLVTSQGAYAYYVPETESGDEVNVYGGKWIGSRTCDSTNKVVILSDDVLSALALTLNESGESCVTRSWSHSGQQYTVICKDNYYYYCNSDGYPYVSRVDDKSYASNQENNYYIDNSTTDNTLIYDEGDTQNNLLLDVDSNTVWFPDGTLYYISQLVYDESTKTYYVDAHSEYDIDNNYYITNNYYYEYHINYTSITYIGATEEYNKTYELYYQLPDGRSSADLTAEDLLALNTAIDVVPYIRVPDDIDIRALYHFDGNVKDSSYWNHMGYFDWRSGASLTYMEANAFNGALYLDETYHRFAIILPDFLGTDDFTFQFRYYQSATEAPQNDSSISIGGQPVLSMNGSHYLDSDGNSILLTSVGSWNELCFMRKDGTLYFYVNGVLYSSWEFGDRLSNEILFTFGSRQQTFKYLDELRVVTSALYDLSGYTPTSVPFDTNLALVLPDTKVPVADGYWKITSSHENLLEAYDLADWSFVNFSHHQYLHDGVDLIEGFANSAECYVHPYSPNACFPHFSYYSCLNDMLSAQSSAFVAHEFQYNSKGDLLTSPYIWLDRMYVPTYGIFSTLVAATSYNNGLVGPQYFLSPGDYVFSMVAADGSVGSLSFTLSENPNGWPTLYFNGYRISVIYSYDTFSDSGFGYYGFLCVSPIDFEIVHPFVYLELVEGTSTDLKAEYVEDVAVLDADSMSTPTLAVRTDLEISGYQIGGVRPSLPDKGLVWALVENGRITSLQIYNGQAWEAVDGRIWTGSRWVPYYAYDVLLLKDMYDIIEADPSQEYIYTEAGFWSWLQRAWGQMMAKLDQIIEALGGRGDSLSDCQHVYEDHVDREPTCAEPGYRTYTCTICGHAYTELIDATGHDWLVTNSIPDVLDEEGNVVEEGYDELTCSICGAESRDYGDGPEEQDIFDALGDFIEDGITWILDKLTELADSLRSITDIFNGFVEKAGALGGSFPAFFGAFVALIPEDLQTVIWFAVVAFVVIAVWKKWSE